MSSTLRSIVSYDIDLDLILKRVYRGSVKDLIGYDDFYDRLVRTASLRLFSKDVCLFLSYGYRYMAQAEKNDFVDLVVIHDDEVDVFKEYDLAIDYFMATASLFFHALIAYQLLRDSDIEDYTNKPRFKLLDVYSGLLIFEYEEY